MLTKTLIEQLNNCYIDCSYSGSDNTIIVNIETPDPKGDDVLQPFTIRTKDGYTLKYNDATGNVKFRILKEYLDDSLTENEVIENYDTYFTEYVLDFKTLSTYENIDPVIQFFAPTYAQPMGGTTAEKPRFEYEDIENQKENIFIIDTEVKNKNGENVFIGSYYGNNPNKCKDRKSVV